jgi:DNA processing protein
VKNLNDESVKISCFEEAYPKKLLSIKEYPESLYCRGNTELLKKNKIVAIVGSRNCSEYGRKYARLFAKNLAKENICVISGLATGIDSAAHDGSIGEEGKTIAVLGGGLNHIYPASNLWLFNKIKENGGLIISEHEDDAETLISGFPKRNRIITGIADAVLVIEACPRSGSKVSAEYAFKQGKKVYCIPMNLDNKNSAGIIELIDKGAKIVTSPRKLIKDLYGANDDGVENVNEKEKESKKSKKYHNGNEHDKEEKNENAKNRRSRKAQNKSPDMQMNIFDEEEIPEKYLDIYLNLEKPLSREEIAQKINKNIRQVNELLTMMEIEGLIEQTAGNMFKRII